MNAYFDGSKLVTAPEIATMPDIYLREYSHHVFRDTNLSIWTIDSFFPLESGTDNYFVAGYLGQTVLGRGFVQTYNKQLPAEIVARGFLRTTANNLRFPPPDAPESDLEAHRVGEVWSGALWDLRILSGCGASTSRCPAADRLVLDAWWSTQPQSDATIGRRFAADLVQRMRRAEGEERAAKMRAAFAGRGLTF